MSSSPTDPETAHATRASRISSGVRAAWISISSPGAALSSFWSTVANDSLGQLSVALVQAGDAEVNAGTGREASLLAARTISGRLRSTSCVREPGRIDNQYFSPVRPFLPVGQKLGIERPGLVEAYVEIRMTDVDRVLGNPLRMVPSRLEGEAAEDEIDVLLDFLDAPARPGPDLRRDEIDDRDAPRLGPPGEPPVKPRIIDEHDGVRPLIAKMAIGQEDQPHERQDVQKDIQETTSPPG